VAADRSNTTRTGSMSRHGGPAPSYPEQQAGPPPGSTSVHAAAGLARRTPPTATPNHSASTTSASTHSTGPTHPHHTPPYPGHPTHPSLK
jgi:hypothetical protein